MSDKYFEKAIEAIGEKIARLELDLWLANEKIKDKDKEIESLKARIAELEEEKENA